VLIFAQVFCAWVMQIAPQVLGKAVVPLCVYLWGVLDSSSFCVLIHMAQSFAVCLKGSLEWLF
jgi:hypothetical protein